MEQGAVLPSLAVRLLQGLEEAGQGGIEGVRGKNVLVIGGTGGVGSLAIQARHPQETHPMTNPRDSPQ